MNKKINKLKGKIQRGIEDIEKGNIAELDMDKIISKAKAIHAKGKQAPNT